MICHWPLMKIAFRHKIRLVAVAFSLWTFTKSKSLEIVLSINQSLGSCPVFFDPLLKTVFGRRFDLLSLHYCCERSQSQSFTWDSLRGVIVSLDSCSLPYQTRFSVEHLRTNDLSPLHICRKRPHIVRGSCHWRIALGPCPSRWQLVSHMKDVCKGAVGVVSGASLDSWSQKEREKNKFLANGSICWRLVSCGDLVRSANLTMRWNRLRWTSSSILPKVPSMWLVHDLHPMVRSVMTIALTIH